MFHFSSITGSAPLREPAPPLQGMGAADTGMNTFSVRNGSRLPDPFPASGASAADTGMRGQPSGQLFLIDTNDQKQLNYLEKTYRRALDENYFVGTLPDALRSVQERFFALRGALVRAASADQGPAAFPGTPPDLCGRHTVPSAFDALLKQSAGVVAGHMDNGGHARRLLMDHLTQLRALGVDTLYVQHLERDVHQDALDARARNAATPGALDAALHGFNTDPVNAAVGGPDGQVALVRQALAAGLRVVALDTFATRRLHGYVGSMERPAHLVALVRSFVGAGVIQQDQATRRSAGDRPGKWVALVDHSLAGDHFGIAGLASRVGAVSLAVQDNGQRHAEAPQGGRFTADYRLRTDATSSEIDTRPPQPWTPAELESALHRPGHYAITLEEGEPLLVHRSRDWQIRRTTFARHGTAWHPLPVQGQDTPPLRAIANQRFGSLAEVRAALPPGMHEVVVRPGGPFIEGTLL